MKKGVQKIYAEVFRTYELVNHVLTLGLDVIWRRKAARLTAKCQGSHWLDVCSGTGEMAQYLSRQAGEKTKIVALDFSLPMLVEAKEKKHMGKVLFSIGDAGILPFSDSFFDLITISFATRNINPGKEGLISYLSEFRRVLKPGGMFIHLETSQPRLALLRMLFHAYVKLVVSPVGAFLSGSSAGYKYLSFTIPRFYPAEELAQHIQEAGFSRVHYRRLFLDIAAIHQASKGDTEIRSEMLTCMSLTATTGCGISNYADKSELNIVS